MPTTRITGTEFSRFDTADTLGGYVTACADLAENFFYVFKNDGTLYKFALPGLTGQTTLATISNFSDTKFMAPHPTNANLLVYFNSTDGINTIHTTTGAVTQLISAAAIDAILSSAGDLLIAGITAVKIRGTKFLLSGNSDPSGSIWEYDPSNNSCIRLLATNALSHICAVGPDATNELLLGGYSDPSLILYTYDLRNDQVKVLAGTGAEGLDDGNALTQATFLLPAGIHRMASDLYYFGNANMTRWIQGGQVGSYANFFPRFIASVLPVRNMVIEVEAHDVIVWT